MKIVHLRRHGNSFRILRADRVRVPESSRELVQMIRHYVQEHRLERIPCVVGLSGDSHMLRLFEWSRSNGPVRAAAIRDQLSPFPGAGDDTCSDYAVISRNNGNSEVLFSMIRSSMAETVLGLAAEAGLNVVIGLVPATIGMFNAVAELHRPSADPFAVIEINPGSSGIMVGEGKNLIALTRFHTHIASPGELRATDDEARFEEWLAEVETSLAVSREEQAGHPAEPKTFYLCGDVVLSEAQISRMEEITGMRRAGGDEPESVVGIGNLKHLHAAFGLALGAIRRNTLSLNLLPEAHRIRLALRRQLKYWMLVGLCAVSASALLFGSMLGEFQRLEKIVRDRERQYAVQQQQERELRQLLDQNDQLNRQLSPLRTAIGNGETVRTVLALLGEAKHESEWITLVADERSYRLGSKTEGSDLRPASAERLERGSRGISPEPVRDPSALDRIVAEGYTPSPDLADVRAMIDALRAVPVVKSADLLPDDRVRRSSARDEEWAFTDGGLFALEIEVDVP